MPSNMARVGRRVWVRACGVDRFAVVRVEGGNQQAGCLLPRDVRLGHHVAAVGDEDVAGNIRGLVGREEDRGTGDLGRLAPTF